MPPPAPIPRGKKTATNLGQTFYFFFNRMHTTLSTSSSSCEEFKVFLVMEGNILGCGAQSIHHLQHVSPLFSHLAGQALDRHLAGADLGQNPVMCCQNPMMCLVSRSRISPSACSHIRPCEDHEGSVVANIFASVYLSRQTLTYPCKYRV